LALIGSFFTCSYTSFNFDYTVEASPVLAGAIGTVAIVSISTGGGITLNFRLEIASLEVNVYSASRGCWKLPFRLVSQPLARYRDHSVSNTPCGPSPVAGVNALFVSQGFPAAFKWNRILPMYYLR
jgi:hypothetical protein